jgi:hypothetical protein
VSPLHRFGKRRKIGSPSRGKPTVPKWELYDIREDPAKKNELAKDHPALVKHFREVLAKNKSLGAYCLDVQRLEK